MPIEWPLDPLSGDSHVAPQDIHVWVHCFDELGEDDVATLGRLLSADEWQRADRFHFRAHRDRFVVAHGAMRSVVAALMGDRAEQVAFAYGPHGKPALAARPDLHVSLSHSDDLALIAVTRVGRLGVDVERLRAFPGLEAIASRFFAPGEHARLMALPASERAAAFFRCWTRKEAYVKARGQGLALALDRFEVSIDADQEARFLRFLDDDDACDRWSLFQIDPHPQYVGAVAVDAPTAHVRVHRLRLGRSETIA